MSAADKIEAARALIEPLRATVLWQNANPNVMKAADLLAALADLADAQAQRIEALEAALRGERERIASGLDAEADTTPCPEDAAVVRGCARLVRADFSYDAADALADAADAQAQEIARLREALQEQVAFCAMDLTFLRGRADDEQIKDIEYRRDRARAALGETP